MKTYFFRLSGVWATRADDLEEANENLMDFLAEFEDVSYNSDPIDIEED